MLPYRALTRRLAQASARRTAALWAALQAGDLEDADFTEHAATVLATADDHAVHLADLAMTAALSASRGRVIAPLGLALPDQTDRLQTAMGTLLGRHDDPDAPDGGWLLDRMSQAEPLSAGQWATGQVLQEHEARWRRVTGPEPCQVCAGLAEGELPYTVSMFHHVGCSCVQQPI